PISVSGLELFTGPLVFRRTELGLILAGLLGTVATPAALIFKHVKKSIWSNSARVVDALTVVRGPLISALVAYGTVSILLRFGDDFLSRLGQNSLLARTPGIGWAGFTWVLPAACLVATGFSYLIARIDKSQLSETKRAWSSVVLRASSMLLILGVVWSGVHFRKGDLAKK